MSAFSLFELIGGSEAALRLARAWHARVQADEVVSHAFSHGFHPKHTERLAAYWSEAWGGPADYSSQYGSESAVVRMHSGNGDHHELDHRAIACFEHALGDVGIQDDSAAGALLDYFRWSTTQRMAAYPKSAADVPDGLRIVKLGAGRTYLSFRHAWVLIDADARLWLTPVGHHSLNCRSVHALASG